MSEQTGGSSSKAALVLTSLALCWASACSHDLDAVPRRDGAVADDGSVDVLAPDAPVSDASDAPDTLDGGLDAPLDAGTITKRALTLTGGPLEIQGATTLLEELIVVGWGIRDPDASEGIFVFLGDTAEVTRVGGMASDRLHDVAAVGGRVIAVGSTESYGVGVADDVFLVEAGVMGVGDAYRFGQSGSTEVLVAIDSDASGWAGVGTIRGADSPDGLLVLGEVSGDPPLAYAIDSGSTGAVTFRDVVVGGDTAYAVGQADSDALVVALNRADGSLRWAQRHRLTENRTLNAVAIGASGLIAVGSGVRAIVNLDGTGFQAWTVATGSTSVVLVADGIENWVGLNSGATFAGRVEGGMLFSGELMDFGHSRTNWSAATQTALGPVMVVGPSAAVSAPANRMYVLPLSRATGCSSTAFDRPTIASGATSVVTSFASTRLSSFEYAVVAPRPRSEAHVEETVCDL